MVYPELLWVDPVVAAPGDEVLVGGSGGYRYRYDASGQLVEDESPQGFRLYLDDRLMGAIMCYFKGCLTRFRIPDAIAAGTHHISTTGGSTITIEIVKP